MNIEMMLKEISERRRQWGQTRDSDFEWMHDTIKQQQQHITELEKEKRKITAAHEAFLEELKSESSVQKSLTKNIDDHFRRGAYIALEYSIEEYNKHFSDIHLAEQVRQAKLSAGVEE